MIALINAVLPAFTAKNGHAWLERGQLALQAIYRFSAFLPNKFAERVDRFFQRLYILREIREFFHSRAQVGWARRSPDSCCSVKFRFDVHQGTCCSLFAAMSFVLSCSTLALE